jgi:hypothetical protein
MLECERQLLNLSLRDAAASLGVSERTAKRRRAELREKRERERARKSAASKHRLRDPATGVLVSYLGQPIRRVRDTQTGRFVSAGPKPEPPTRPEPTDAEIAEVVARYPLRVMSDDSRFATDARRVLDVLARRLLDLGTPTNARRTLIVAREAERLHKASSLVSGNTRLMAGAGPMRAATTIDPLARERYDGALTLILYSDRKTPITSLLALSCELVRARLKLGIL